MRSHCSSVKRNAMPDNTASNSNHKEKSDFEIGSIETLKNKLNANYVVKITNPLRLAKDVTAWAKNEQLPLIGEAEWIKVRYDKGLIVEESFTSAQFAELSYSQKYPASSDESEYRLVVTTSDTIAQNNDEHEEAGCENSLYVKLGRRLNYVGANL